MKSVYSPLTLALSFVPKSIPYVPPVVGGAPLSLRYLADCFSFLLKGS